MRNTLFLLYLLCATASKAQDVPLGSELPYSAEKGVDRSEDSALLIYPNPTSGRFLVHWGERSLQRIPVEVRAMDGRLMHLDVISTTDELDVTTLPDGTDVLYLMDLGGVRAARLFRVAH